MKKQEESDIHHNDDVYNLDIYSAKLLNGAMENFMFDIQIKFATEDYTKNTI